MRVMGLDIGSVRCGVAISDPAGRVSSPLVTMPSKDVLECSKDFKRLLEDWEPEVIVCGLPLSLSGEEGKQASTIRRACEKITSTSGIECTFADERLSSKEAKAALHEMGYDEKQMRGKVDMIAASIFLQTWLDRQAKLESDGSSCNASTHDQPAL